MSDVFQSSVDLLTENQSGGYKLLKEEIFGMRSTLKQAMDKGLPPSDMEVAQAVAEAVDAADVAVEKIYTKLFD
jgi:hypothetical protein